MASETCQMWQKRRFKGGKTDVSNVASETLQTWQVRHFRCGKRDVSKVAKEMFLRWQERRLKRGKSDVKRYHLRRGFYGSDTPRCHNSDLLVGI